VVDWWAWGEGGCRPKTGELTKAPVGNAAASKRALSAANPLKNKRGG
jgi:hypothetical protein